MIKVAYRRKNGSKSLLKLNFIIITNGNRDGCTPLNDCAMIRGYRDSTKALIGCMNNRGRVLLPNVILSSNPVRILRVPGRRLTSIRTLASF